jgi:CHAT domain
MTEKVRILILSANPWSTGRILLAEEAREIFDRIHEGPYRDKFELHDHGAVRPIDLQRLLLKYEPQIVHFSGHGSKSHRILLNGTHGRSQALDQQGLADVFALYNSHVRLVLLNACFTKGLARSISEVVDYSIGTARPIGDKVSVAFAGAFYRALGFGKSIRDAFNSARRELALTKMPRSRGIELFVKSGLDEEDRFPQIDTDPYLPAISVKENAVVEVTTIKTIQQTILIRG